MSHRKYYEGSLEVVDDVVDKEARLSPQQVRARPGQAESGARTGASAAPRAAPAPPPTPRRTCPIQRCPASSPPPPPPTHTQ